MKRYFNEVKKVDRGEMPVKEFVEKMFSEPEIYEVMAAYRIYKEDGGRKYSYQDFLNAVGLKETEEDRQVFKGFMNSKL